MKTRKIIGWVLLSLFIIAVIGFFIHELGSKKTLIIFCGIIAVVGIPFFAIYLIIDNE